MKQPPAPTSRFLPSARGFTLVEMVVTLVIASILAVGVLSFIGDSVSSFAIARNNNQLASAGRAVIDRMALELVNAVPGSARVSANSQCLEFLPFNHASSYVDAPFNVAAQDFEVVDFTPALTLPSPAGVNVVVYPLSATELYTVSATGPLAAVDSIIDSDSMDGKVRLELTAPHLFPRRSPLERIFIVEQPVSFCLSGDKLYRYGNYGFDPGTIDCAPGCLPSGTPGRSLVAQSIAPSPIAFRVISPTLQRNSMVALNLNFGQAGSAIHLQHQVLMRNVP